MALPLLAEHGVESLTVKAVADALAVSPPAVYHYVDSREHLVDLLCERVTADLAMRIDRRLEADHAWDDGIVDVLVEMGRAFARYPGLAARVLISRQPSRAADDLTATIHGLLVRGGYEPRRAEEVVVALQSLSGGWFVRRGPADRALFESAIRWLLAGAR